MVIGTTAALIGSAAIGAGASMAASSKAASAAQKGVDSQERIYNQTRADQEPWRQVGQQALSQLARVYGFDVPANDTGAGAVPQYITQKINGKNTQVLNPAYKPPRPANAMAAGAPDYSSFFKSPDYQFRFDEGQRAVTNSAAARGSLMSGASLKALQSQGQNTAAGEYTNWFNRMSNLAGLGQTANQANQSAGAQYGNAMMQGAQNRASAYQNQGNALAYGAQNVAQGLGNYMYSPSPVAGLNTYQYGRLGSYANNAMAANPNAF